MSALPARRLLITALLRRCGPAAAAPVHAARARAITGSGR